MQRLGLSVSRIGTTIAGQSFAVRFFSSASNKMNAIDILKSEHVRFKEYLKQFSKDRNDEVLKNLIVEIKIHEKMEEKIFYPEVKAHSTKAKEMVREGKEEHHVVDFLIDEIENQTLSPEKLYTKVHVMGENLEHHIKEEEVQE